MHKPGPLMTITARCALSFVVVAAVLAPALALRDACIDWTCGNGAPTLESESVPLVVVGAAEFAAYQGPDIAPASAPRGVVDGRFVPTLVNGAMSFMVHGDCTAPPAVALVDSASLMSMSNEVRVRVLPGTRYSNDYHCLKSGYYRLRVASYLFDGRAVRLFTSHGGLTISDVPK